MTTPTTYFALAQPVVGASDNSWGTEENTIFGLVDGLFATGRWVAAGGTVDAITATYSPAPSPMVLVDGMIVGFRAVGANTSTTPTFAPNGLTARTIVKNGGQALAAGDIAGANHECLLRYYAVSTRWELLNPVAGDYVSASQANQATGLTTATGSSTASISLTPGDWDVRIDALFDGDAATVVDRVIASLSTVNSTVDSATIGYRADACGFHLTPFAYSRLCVTVGPVRVNVAATTTYYFVSQATFTVGACGTGGIISARRIK